MPLLVVLVEGVDVVLLPVALPGLLGLRLFGDEVESVAGRRPGDVRDRGRVMRERPRFAAGVIDEVDLGSPPPPPPPPPPPRAADPDAAPRPGPAGVAPPGRPAGPPRGAARVRPGP